MLELYGNLSSMTEALSPHLKKKLTEAGVHDYGHCLALAQSAVLCMDVIARSVKSGSRKAAVTESWSSILRKSLAGTIAVAELLLARTLQEMSSSTSESFLARVMSLRGDELKLLGSVLLLAATVSDTLGPAALSTLNVRHLLFSINLF